MRTINTRRYRHRVIIEQPTDAQDSDYGSSTVTWSVYKKAWVSIEPLSGRELIVADALESQITHRVRSYRDSGVNSRMRLQFGSRTFEITSPPLNLDEANREMQLMCREVE